MFGDYLLMHLLEHRTHEQSVWHQVNRQPILFGEHSVVCGSFHDSDIDRALNKEDAWYDPPNPFLT